MFSKWFQKTQICQIFISRLIIFFLESYFDDPLLNSIRVPQLMGSFGCQWRRFCSDSEILPLLVVLHYSLEYCTRCFPMKPMSLLMPCKNFDWGDNIKDDYLNNCFWFDVGNDNTGLRSGGVALQTIGILFRLMPHSGPLTIPPQYFLPGIPLSNNDIMPNKIPRTNRTKHTDYKISR